jgi:hypothetical protein
MVERKISKVFCISYPFSVERKPAEAELDLDYWKSVIDRVRHDPAAVLVGAIPFEGELGRRLRDYANERLGNRFRVLAGSRLLLDSYKEKGLAPLSKTAKIFACGEYYDVGVAKGASRLASALGIPRERSS